MARLTFLTAFLFLLSAATCLGDQWISPRPIEAQSPNGLYKVRTRPGSSLGDSVGFEGDSKGEFAKAEWTGPKGEKRTFTLLNPISPVDIVLLDDGTLLTFDNWHNMGYGAVLVSYSAKGAVKWSHPLEDLLPKEVLELVPTSVSSRWWRKQPLEWKVREGEAGIHFGFVTLWNEDELKINIGTGAVEYVDPKKARQARGGEVLVELIAEQPVVSRNEPVLARLRISNHSERAVKIDLGGDFKKDILLSVTEPDGTIRESSFPRLPDEASVPGNFILQSGENRDFRLLLDEWYSFSRVGTYSIHLSVPTAKSLSASTKIQVTKEDPARVAVVCKSLASEAMACDFEMASLAAKALSYTRSEDCLPDLEAVLKRSRHGRQWAAAALASLGTASALDLLVEWWDRLGSGEQSLVWNWFEIRAITGVGQVFREKLESSGRRPRNEDPWSLGILNPAEDCTPSFLENSEVGPNVPQTGLRSKASIADSM